jgi:hypothetical protein
VEVEQETEAEGRGPKRPFSSAASLIVDTPETRAFAKTAEEIVRKSWNREYGITTDIKFWNDVFPSIIRAIGLSVAERYRKYRHPPSPQ